MKPVVVVLALVCTLAVSGCRSQASGSGFLGGPEVYEALEPSPEYGEEVMSWRSPDMDLTRFTRIKIHTVQVHLNEEGKERGVDEAQLAKLAAFFRKQVEEQFALGWPVVDEGDESTMGIRVALTDVRPSRPKAGVPLPTTLFGLGVGGATLEAEFLDEGSGQRLAAAVIDSTGSGYKIARGWKKWGHAEDVLRYWADMMRSRVDALSGRAQRKW